MPPIQQVSHVRNDAELYAYCINIFITTLCLISMCTMNILQNNVIAQVLVIGLCFVCIYFAVPIQQVR